MQNWTETSIHFHDTYCLVMSVMNIVLFSLPRDAMLAW